MSCSPFSYRIYSVGYVFEYLNHLSRFRCERSFRRWLGYLIVEPHRAVCHEVFCIAVEVCIDCIRHSVQSLIEPGCDLAAQNGFTVSGREFGLIHLR